MKTRRAQGDELLEYVHDFVTMHPEGNQCRDANSKLVALIRYHCESCHREEHDCKDHPAETVVFPNPFYVAPTRAVPPRLRFLVLKRDNFRCRYCGAGADKSLQVDHVVPVSKGGRTVLDNLVTACFDCNSGKSDIQ